MDALKKLVMRWFPALKDNSFAPKLAKIVAINDAPVHGGKCSQARPRYAVDIQPLDEHFQAVGPVWRDVVCAMPYAGKQQGFFALPEVGTLIEYTQSYCLPHLIHLRAVIPWGLELPPLDVNEARWQQSNNVYQKYDKQGNWHRVTDKAIIERCEQVHQNTAKLKQLIKVDNGGTVWLGNHSDNVLQILADFMEQTASALSALASHTHGGSPVPDVKGQVQGCAKSISNDKTGRLDSMVE